jgi:hypothetical protein
MDTGMNENEGLQGLIRKFRSEFRRHENTHFYSDEDYKEAERKFVKFRLTGKKGS